MTQFGYTALCEQTPVNQLVTDLVAAEEAGFDFSVMSDHYFPWIEEQGHSGYAWSVLGAAAQATQRLPLMTFVTCPAFRYHPAVVAQKAATVSCGPDAGQHAKAVKQYVDAGFTHVALVQVGGGSQAEFITWARDELLPALREL